MKKLSIIIPVFNGEKYILKCLNSINDSIKACKYNIINDIEIIVINDGSFDNTRKMLNQFYGYEYFKIINKNNEGVSKTRNIGLSYASSEYVTFIDADDYVGQNYFNVIFNSLTDNPEMVIYNEFYNVVNEKVSIINSMNSQKCGEYECSEIFCYFVDQKLNSVWNKIFKLRILKEKKIEFNNLLKISEDYLFVMDYVNSINKIYIERLIPYYYLYNKNGSKKIKKDYLDNIYYVHNYLSARIKNKNKSSEYSIFLSRLLHQAIEFIGYYSKHNEIYDINKDFLEDIKKIKFYSLKSNIEKLLFIYNNKVFNKIWYRICWKK